MTQKYEDLCEQLDAALFSGDTFNNVKALDELDQYLERWKRQSAEIREWLNEV